MPNIPPGNLEREIDIVARLSRLGHLVELSYMLRLGTDDWMLLDRVARYSLLGIYLDDSVTQALRGQGKSALAEMNRRLQRKRYAELLNAFSGEVLQSYTEWRDDLASSSWADYRSGAYSIAKIRLTIFELRIAFALHGFGLQAGHRLALRACGRIRFCFPPADVIPIRSFA